MGPLVDLEVLRPGEHLPAAGERTRKGLLASVHSDVVHQFVLGFEGPTRARTALPEAGVTRTLRAADVVHRQVSHYFVDGGVALPTTLATLGPETGDPRPRVAEEGPSVVARPRWRVLARIAVGVGVLLVAVLLSLQEVRMVVMVMVRVMVVHVCVSEHRVTSSQQVVIAR